MSGRWTDGLPGRSAIERHQPAGHPTVEAHFNHEELFPIGRKIRTVSHAILWRRIDRAVLAAALGRGRDRHLVAPAGQFGKQEPRLIGPAVDPGQP